MKSIEEIKKELREIIALSEKATKGPWTIAGFGGIGWKDCVDKPDGTYLCAGDSNDAAFIARSRTITPKMAKALLSTIDYLVGNLTCYGEECACQHHASALGQLETICREWEANSK